MNTPVDLNQYIQEQNIAARLVHPSQETPTVALAAQALGCREEQIIKSVLFVIKQDEDQRVALVIANGTAQLDYRKLAALFGVGRKRIRLAPPELVVALTGYPAGGVPPFGFPAAVPTYIDQQVLTQPVVYGGGGDDRTLMQVAPQELVRVTGAQVIDARA